MRVLFVTLARCLRLPPDSQLPGHLCHSA